MTCKLHLLVRGSDGGASEVEVPIDQVLLAGYTGRNRHTVLEHIRELETLGIPPPPRVPSVYVVAPELITSEPRIVVNEPETSGEAEFVVVDTPQGALIGVGSDHTDRRRERTDIAASKAQCSKVVCPAVWRLADVVAHWDTLVLRAWTTDADSRHLYQEGSLRSLLPVPELLAEIRRAGFPLTRQLIFGGTLPTRQGFIFGKRFEVELDDPVLGRQLRCAYDVSVE